jgi:uncharacterized lipoprotein YddW (UPF0748 family)
MIKNKFKKMLSLTILSLLLGMSLFGTLQATAAKETTKPSVSLKTSTTDPTSSKVKIEIKATDKSGISIVKWATGSKDTKYFKESGKKITLSTKSTASVSVSKNGIYTFYVKDKAGNEKLKKITIKNIDTVKSTITIKKSTSEVTNKSVKLTLAIKDEGLGIKSIKYLTGKKYTADFSKAGKNVKFKQTKVDAGTYSSKYYYTASFTAKSNNTYTFLVEDMAGNKSLRRSYITNIDKDAPIITYSFNTKNPTNKSVKVTVTGVDEASGVKEIVYLSGSKKVDDFMISKPTTIKLNTSNKGSFKATKNGSFTVLITDNAGNQTLEVIKVSNIDTTAPKVDLDYSVMNQTATITVDPSDKGSGIQYIKFIKGKLTDIASDKWETKAADITEFDEFYGKSSGNYSVLVEDKAGNKTIEVIYVELEFKAVWISYLEFLAYGQGGYAKDNFEFYIDYTFDNIVKLGMNAVVVHVRPFGDAMYDSNYFPWSKYASGKQGVDPGFDPLEYMVEAAHDRGLELHAWLNPYRVTTASTDYKLLAKDNPAREWYEDDDKTNDRNVLSFGGNLYYNPASKEVQSLITKGIKEIVLNYDVDGIHFDDYFYPTLGSNYAKVFDNVEYITYVSETKEAGKTPQGIADWRRNNVNTLVKNIYKTIKNIDTNIQFGISPGGFLDYLYSDQAYYVDYKTWMSSDKYIDYICPQIYWTFSNKTYPYAKTLDRWLAARTSPTVKVYVGIANYRAGSTLEPDWKNDPDVLRNQVEYGRDTGLVDGFIFFRYDFFYNKVTKPGTDRLLEILRQ